MAFKHAKQCRAASKRTGNRCGNPARRGREVCRNHGGNTPRGSRSPHFKTGNYSKYPPPEGGANAMAATATRLRKLAPDAPRCGESERSAAAPRQSPPPPAHDDGGRNNQRRQTGPETDHRESVPLEEFGRFALTLERILCASPDGIREEQVAALTALIDDYSGLSRLIRQAGRTMTAETNAAGETGREPAHRQTNEKPAAQKNTAQPTGRSGQKQTHGGLDSPAAASSGSVSDARAAVLQPMPSAAAHPVSINGDPINDDPTGGGGQAASEIGERKAEMPAMEKQDPFVAFLPQEKIYQMCLEELNSGRSGLEVHLFGSYKADFQKEQIVWCIEDAERNPHRNSWD